MLRLIEELSMNAWPALHTELYDGWILRFSKGYTKRANSINPIYNSTLDVNYKIGACEQLFYKQGLPVIFKLTPAAFPLNLDNILSKRGYKYIDTTSVQILNLDKVKLPYFKNITLYTKLSEQWLQDYSKLNNVEYENMNLLRTMLELILPLKLFVSMSMDNKVIACGLGVLQDGYLGLFDIIVAPELRGQGYGEQLVLNLLNLGKKNGAQYAYLQVAEDNLPAARLYSKLNFKEQYKYWYRVKL